MPCLNRAIRNTGIFLDSNLLARVEMYMENNYKIVKWPGQRKAKSANCIMPIHQVKDVNKKIAKLNHKKNATRIPKTG